MIVDSNFNINKYIKKQLLNFFPDNKKIDCVHLEDSIATSIERLEYCFDHIKLPSFRKFNYLHSDQNAMFLYILSNELYKNCENIELATKVMYLNKIMHSLNIMYDNDLPPIFCFIHIVGTVIGKAKFGNYLTVYQNVTIGANKNIYPELKDCVTLCANTSVIGDGRIGSNVTIGAGVNIFNDIIPDYHNAILNNDGKIEIRPAKSFISDMLFIKETK